LCESLGAGEGGGPPHPTQKLGTGEGQKKPEEIRSRKKKKKSGREQWKRLEEVINDRKDTRTRERKKENFKKMTRTGRRKFTAYGEAKEVNKSQNLVLGPEITRNSVIHRRKA